METDLVSYRRSLIQFAVRLAKLHLLESRVDDNVKGEIVAMFMSSYKIHCFCM